MMHVLDCLFVCLKYFFFFVFGIWYGMGLIGRLVDFRECIEHEWIDVKEIVHSLEKCFHLPHLDITFIIILCFKSLEILFECCLHSNIVGLVVLLLLILAP